MIYKLIVLCILIDPYGNYFSIFGFANEGNLRDYLEKKFSILRGDDKIQMALDITRGLACLHSKKIIHGDLVNQIFLI